MIRFFVGKIIFLDEEPDHGESPVTVSLFFGDFNIIKLFLELGADPSPLEWNKAHRLALGPTDDLLLRQLTADDLGKTNKK